MDRMKTTTLFLALTLSYMGWSQERTPVSSKEELLREVIVEKWRNSSQEYTGNSSLSHSAKSSGFDQSLSGSTATGLEEAETYIAVNPNDSNHIVASYMSFDANQELIFPIYYSEDGGNVWKKSNFSSDSLVDVINPGAIIGGGGDPVFEFDPNGTVYFSWIYLHLNPSFDTAFFDLMWAYSTDMGRNWDWSSGDDKFIGQGSIDLITGGIEDYKDGIFDRQWMAVDRSGGPFDGNLYTSCVFFPNNITTLAGDGIVVRVKPSGASAFNTANSVVTTNQSQFANVQVSSMGVVHVSYADLITESIMHSKSIDGGQTFSTPTIIDQGTNLFGGLNIQHGRENAATNMVIDGNDNLHVVWTNFSAGGFGSGFSSIYARSGDGGSSWTTTQLDSIFPDHVFMPTVSAHGTRVAISGHSITDNDTASYWIALSPDAGINFNATQQVSSTSHQFTDFSTQAWFGDYDKSSRTHCNVFSIFSDGRDGTVRTYVAKYDQCASIGVPEITTLNGNLSIGSPYPNPSFNRISIEVSGTEGDRLTWAMVSASGIEYPLGTYDILVGKQVLSLEWSDLPKGLYFLKGEGLHGDRFTRKIRVH